MSSLLLAGPYGWNSPSGHRISLRCSKPPDEAKLAEVLLQFSCHPPAIKKIASCLRHSGRYDCLVQYGWFREGQIQLRKMLADIGVEIQATKRQQT